MADLLPSTLKPAAKSVQDRRGPDAARGMTLFVMIVATLYFGREVLVPVTLALLLAFILAPLVDLLRRVYLGRVPAVVLGVIVALGAVTAIGGVIGSQIAELSTDLPGYVTTVETKIATVKHYTVGQLSRLANNVGGRHKDTDAPLITFPSLQAPSAAQPSTATAPAAPAGGSPVELAERYLSPVLAPLATVGIVFIVAVFALLQREDLRDRLIRLIGSEDLHRTTLAIDDAARRLSRYFLTQLCINAGFGVVIGIGLLIVGVPNPVLWGILSALLRFVPYVGSLISALLPLALAAAIEPGWGIALSTALLYVGVEGVTGQIVEPLVYGRSTGLSPFSVVVAAIFWSWLWGPVGLILSTPLTLCLVAMGRHTKRLEFLDIMLGDRPALTPVESFYQRVLSGDADETQDHAERLLKDRSLSTYYDEVAVKGLQLAVGDAQRGALDAEQLDQIKVAVQSLIRGLDRHVDKQPTPVKTPQDQPLTRSDEARDLPRNPDPPSLTVPQAQLPESWRGPGAVLCVAGRGPLDALPAAMLAQLVGKHGLGARQIAYAEVARDQIDALDIGGAAMVCVTYLDIGGSPAHLRYLLQRLRQKLPPGTPLLVGLWPAGDAMRDATIGADIFATSLEQAVTNCIAAAERTAN